MAKPVLPPGEWDKKAVEEYRSDAYWAYLDGKNARAKALNRNADALNRRDDTVHAVACVNQHDALVAALEDLLPILERHLARMAAPPGISDEQAAAVLETNAYKTAKGRIDRARAALLAA